MVVDKNDIKSILFVKNKPSDITEEGITYRKLSYYKKGDVLYVVGDRMVLFRSNCSYMFNVFSNIEQIDFSNVNTSKVTDMKGMFYNCTNLKSVTFGDNFDTSNVTDMGSMFDFCNNLTSLDLSNFNTSKVTDMKYMFYECNKLTSLNLSNFDTSNVTNMRSMFDCW